MKKILLIALITSLTSCVQNVGGKYEWFIEANQKIFDFSTPGDFTFNNTEIEISSNTATVQVNYSIIDEFSDATYAGTWTPTTINGIGHTYTETAGELQYDCQSGIMAVELTTPQVLTDYTSYVEITPTVFDNASKPLTIIGRYGDSSNFYIGITDNINHYIYIMNGGFMFSLASVPTTITQTVGVKYAQKLKMDGTNLYYKIWEVGTTEPAWLVTTTDATFANGSFALSCYSGNGKFDNARVYEVAANTDYDTTNPSFVFPEYDTSSVTLSRYESIEIDATTSGSDTIKFDISDDGGATFMAYSSGSWQTNGAGYAGAMSLAEVNQYLKYFPTSASSITFRAYMHSNTGITTPFFNSLTLTYSTQL